LLDPVVEYFKPQRVILFGSRARGEATRDSDIDLLVDDDDDTPPEKLAWQKGHEARRSRHAADVFPMRAETFERDRNIVGTLAAEADAAGVVVFGSPAVTKVGNGSRIQGMAGADRRAELRVLVSQPPAWIVIFARTRVPLCRCPLIAWLIGHSPLSRRSPRWP
jgi:nucleotidyltransferase-like protein